MEISSIIIYGVAGILSLIGLFCLVSIESSLRDILKILKAQVGKKP